MIYTLWGTARKAYGVPQEVLSALSQDYYYYYYTYNYYYDYFYVYFYYY